MRLLSAYLRHLATVLWLFPARHLTYIHVINRRPPGATKESVMTAAAMIVTNAILRTAETVVNAANTRARKAR